VSQLSRDLILRMLVVDPMKRITMSEIRAHPWFQHKLPSYLSMPPEVRVSGCQCLSMSANVYQCQ